MRKSMLLAAGALALAAAPAAGQTIAQGMTPAQVQSEFGAPATTREAGAWTYWYYHNGCPRRCGSDDVVFFQNDRVVAAVLRTGHRRFAGPRVDEALQATDDGTSAVHVNAGAPAATVIVGGVRVEGGRPAAPPPAASVIVVPAPQEAEPGTPVPAREGRPGEPSTISIDRTGAEMVLPARDSASTPRRPASTPAAAPREPSSVDRKAERNRRRTEPSSVDRARRNDRP
jgi:hypothetical protein